MLNHIRADYTAHYDARVEFLVALQRITLIAGIAFGAALIWVGSYTSAALTAAFLALLTYTVYLRRQGEAPFASILLAAAFLAEPATAIIVSGGIHSPYIVWLAVPIFAAGGLFGGRGGLLAAANAIVTFCGLFLLDAPLRTLNELPGEAYASMYFASFNSAALFASTLAWIAISSLERESQAAQKSALETALRAEELRQAEQGLRDQIRARDKLYAVISHELRTPAATLKMLLEDSVIAQLESPEQSTINDLLEHMLSIMEDMRLAREPEQLRHAPRVRARVSDVLSQAVKMAERFVSESGLTVRIRLNGETEIPVEIPRRVLRQITINIVKNCAVHAEAEHLEIGIEWRRNGDAVDYTIRFMDDGHGVSPSDQRLLFRAFARGDSAADGSGIGLNVCREYARNVLAGDLTYTTSPWGGAAFVLTARFNAVQHASADLEVRREATEPLRHARVLLAEDSNILRVLTGKLLEQRGAIVTLACDGKEALRRMEAEHFDLVVVDLQMPKIDGLEFTRRLREQGASLPIIGLTAALGADATLLRRAGADAVLTKPLDVERLEHILGARASGSHAAGDESVAA
ncbi:MAG: response regulator [Pseudomonadota bacterium]|nr:response regulator [Pseudomonadota bacterium]